MAIFKDHSYHKWVIFNDNKPIKMNQELPVHIHVKKLDRKEWGFTSLATAEVI